MLYFVRSYGSDSYVQIPYMAADERKKNFVQRIVYSESRRTFVMSNGKRRCSARGVLPRPRRTCGSPTGIQ
jgi:hypothetical protein